MDWLTYDGTQEVLGSVSGVQGQGADESEDAVIDAVREDYDDATDYYLLAAVEDDDDRNIVRVDLDRAGWLALAGLCTEVVARMEREGEK